MTSDGPKGTRILVADDDEAVLLTLAAVLARIPGAGVSTANSVDAAVAALREEPFDVLVTELSLESNEDGLSLVGRSRELQPGIVPIVLTGAPSLESAVLALRLGAANYLLKPCSIDELKLAIASALDAGNVRQPALPRAETERRVASRMAPALGALRERIMRLEREVERRELDDAIRYEVQQVQLAASRLEATVDTLLEPIRSSEALADPPPVRAEVLGPSHARNP